MDLTPEPEIYRACAEASWEAPGTQRLWRSYQRETYVELMLARPDFCALVDVAYRAGQEDACKRVQAIPEHPEMVPNAAEEWQSGFRWGWHYAIKAVRETFGQEAGDDR